jgi:hypothetical protein
MPKLNDTQLILLSTAAQRAVGSLLPLPEVLASAGVRATKAIASLIKGGHAAERETSDTAMVYRTDGDISFGVFITDTGKNALDAGSAEAPAPTPVPGASKPERATKSAAVVALLGREHGATLTELIEATGWLPHTTRAALTGLRKKGHTVGKTKAEGVTTYFIVTEADRANA